MTLYILFFSHLLSQVSAIYLSHFMVLIGWSGAGSSLAAWENLILTKMMSEWVRELDLNCNDEWASWENFLILTVMMSEGVRSWGELPDLDCDNEWGSWVPVGRTQSWMRWWVSNVVRGWWPSVAVLGSPQLPWLRDPSQCDWLLTHGPEHPLGWAQCNCSQLKDAQNPCQARENIRWFPKSHVFEKSASAGSVAFSDRLKIYPSYCCLRPSKEVCPDGIVNGFRAMSNISIGSCCNK